MNRKDAHGFTLIELMIVIVIISILSMVAYPAYKDQMNKTRRSDAKAALTTAAALQERWFTEKNSYTNTIGNIGGSSSPEKYYTMSVSIPGSAGCTSGTLFYCYQITATATGAQLNDKNCRTLTVDNKGIKASTDSGGAASSGCW